MVFFYGWGNFLPLASFSFFPALFTSFSLLLPPIQLQGASSATYTYINHCAWPHGSPQSIMNFETLGQYISFSLLNYFRHIFALQKANTITITSSPCMFSIISIGSHSMSNLLVFNY